MEQFNLRALVNSEQDDLEIIGIMNNLIPVVLMETHQQCFKKQGTKGTFAIGSNSFDLQHDYPNFFSLPALDDDNVLSLTSFTTQANSLWGVDLEVNAVVPKVSKSDSSIGFFHESDTLSQWNRKRGQSFFEIPDSPMLSIFQFRHANLNNYFHGPSYAFGNSYASPQVARYKTWGKMKAFSMQPIFPGMDIRGNIATAKDLQNAGLPYNPFIWEPMREISYDDPIREKFVNNDHQNITPDHSFYLNYSLMDGYFTSGLGIGSEWDLLLPEEFEPGSRFLPSGILDCYPIFGMVNGSKQVMLKKVRSWPRQVVIRNTDTKHLLGDLLVDGTFNINSTSVDAWVSQLASLRGKPIEGLVVPQDETPVLRFQDYTDIDENSWNKIRFLTDAEINLLAYKIVEQVKLRGFLVVC